VEIRKTPLIIGLIAVVVVLAAVVFFQTRRPAKLSASGQDSIAATQPEPREFTPAPR
jgi:hypothetical protein